MRNNSTVRTRAACGSVVSAHDFAADAGVAGFDQRNGPHSSHGAHQLNGEFIRDIDHVEQDAVVFFEFGGILDQEVRQFGVSRVRHNIKEKVKRAWPARKVQFFGRAMIPSVRPTRAKNPGSSSRGTAARVRNSFVSRYAARKPTAASTAIPAINHMNKAPPKEWMTGLRLKSDRD